MTLDLVLDLPLLPERSVDAPSGDDNDATGWDRLLGITHYVAGKLVSMESPMRLLVDDLLHGDVDPDEESQPDKGRLARSVIVLYRTSMNDPMKLLGPEQNQ